MRIPGRDATLGSDVPQSPSPPTIPGGAVALARTDLASACLFILTLGRRVPIGPPVYVGCGFDEYQTDSGGHLGIDFYKTPGDVYVPRSCDFQGSGVPGANVYPAFPGCPHQGTANKAKVIYAADAGGAIGNCVILEHTDNTHLIWIRTCYMHLDTIAVAVGAFVATTDVIGTVGGTGINPFTGRTYAADNNNHLHFEVWEQRAVNLGWRTAAEIALMPNTIVRPRSAINAEKYLPPLEGDDLLHIASPPPPAGNPNYPPLPPLWVPQFTFPCDGGRAGHLITGQGTNHILIEGPVVGGTMKVYPFMDAPEGRIYVEGVGIGSVTLRFGDYPYDYYFETFYYLDPMTTNFVIHVVTGQWINMATKVMTLTAIGAVRPGLYLDLDVFGVNPPSIAHVPPGNYYWEF